MTMKRTRTVTLGLAALGVLFVGCSIATSPSMERGRAYAMLGQRDVAQADWARATALERDPWTKAAMQRSAGLGPPPAIVSVVTPDTPPPTVPPAPVPGTGAATVPIAHPPSPVKAT